MQYKVRIAIGGFIILGLTVWALLPNPLLVEVAPVVQGQFERAIEEEGKTRLRERYLVSSPVAGRLARLDLKQGDAIGMGDTVATLWPADPGLIDARTKAEQTARLGVLLAANVRAQTRVASTQAALNQSRIDLQRISTLTRQGFVSPSQSESALLTVQLREKEHEAAIQDSNAARAELQQLRATMQDYAQTSARQNHTPFSVKAPVGGRVFRVMQQSEAVINAGTVLVELGDPALLEIEVALLTEDAAQINAGDAVQIIRWGGTDLVTGRVSNVEPAAFTKVSTLGVEEQRVKAIIQLDKVPDSFRAVGDGFKVDVRILVQVVKNARMIPVSALFPVGSRSAVFTLQKGRAVQQEVQVYARNGVSAWIAPDLAMDTQVIVYPDSQLKNGAKVKIR